MPLVSYLILFIVLNRPMFMCLCLEPRVLSVRWLFFILSSFCLVFGFSPSSYRQHYDRIKIWTSLLSACRCHLYSWFRSAFHYIISSLLRIKMIWQQQKADISNNVICTNLGLNTYTSRAKRNYRDRKKEWIERESERGTCSFRYAVHLLYTVMICWYSSLSMTFHVYRISLSISLTSTEVDYLFDSVVYRFTIKLDINMAIQQVFLCNHDFLNKYNKQEQNAFNYYTNKWIS